MDVQLVQHHLLKDCLLLIEASLCWLYLCGSLSGMYILFHWSQFSLVAQSGLTLCNHGQQHTRPPCPSPTPGVYSNSSPLSRWCHPTITSSVIPFSCHLQYFPASGSFPMRQFFPKYWRFSFSISTSNEYSGLIFFRMDRLDLLSVQGTLKSLLQHYSSKESVLQCSGFFTLSSIHDYWKNHGFD